MNINKLRTFKVYVNIQLLAPSCFFNIQRFLYKNCIKQIPAKIDIWKRIRNAQSDCYRRTCKRAKLDANVCKVSRQHCFLLFPKEHLLLPGTEVRRGEKLASRVKWERGKGSFCLFTKTFFFLLKLFPSNTSNFFALLHSSFKTIWFNQWIKKRLEVYNKSSLLLKSFGSHIKNSNFATGWPE